MINTRAMKKISMAVILASLFVSCQNNDGVEPKTTARFTATKSFTANCSAGLAGESVTKTVTMESAVSQADADEKATNAAMTEANKAVTCVTPINYKLFGLFKMDGDASDSTNVLGTGTATDVVFGPGSAFFNGVSSFIRIPGGVRTFTVQDQFSVTLFFKAGNPNRQERLFQMVDENGNSIELYTSNSRIRFTNWDEASNRETMQLVSQGAPDFAAWNKVVATINFTSNTANLYVNDMLAGTIEMPLKKLNVSTIFLGKHVGDIPGSFYSGELDNVRVYNTVIEPSLFPLIKR
jgi:hypothetical protein